MFSEVSELPIEFFVLPESSYQFNNYQGAFSTEEENSISIEKLMAHL